MPRPGCRSSGTRDSSWPSACGVLAVANADQRAAGGLDLLGDGHEVAVAADDDDGADVGEAADVFGGIEAELDVGAVLG